MTDVHRPPKPLVIDIHTEPDGTFIDRRDNARWVGFEKGFRLMSGLRRMIEDRTGRPAHYSWHVRVDAQIEAVYGTAGWALHRYARQIETLRQAGDDIGLHSHGYRWDAGSDGWIEDYGDQAWMEDVTAKAFEAFRAVFGHAPESFASGATWTNTPLIRLVERLGAKYDLTAAPRQAIDFPTHLGAFSGAIPDTRRMPLHPYRPSVGDFQVPDPARTEGIWIIPLTVGRQAGGGLIKRTLRRHAGTLRRHEFVTKLFLQLPLEYLVPAFDTPAAMPEPTHFTLDIRSDGFRTAKNRAAIRRNLTCLTQPERRFRLALSTPAELVRDVQSQLPAAA